ncbi:hypothetical protein [Myroides guanonis]|uniref:Uncharacterized protein n=1 Tax=Myroides guanonis TaxID=1150112 RepID=A0A1I3PG82_9FLAO|nr:hypothetical protein [Myroides guanonis]SFJ20565.1 hypothetical protein SAMN04487893_104118 [Myroides guanonis]
MRTSIFILFTFLFFSKVTSQTRRDTLANNIIHFYPDSKESYFELKEEIAKLKLLEGKNNPEILYNNLERMYDFKDFNYFKEILTLLTKEYGFNISYMSGYENYYKSITKGDLAKWFKKMYVKNHSKWLSKNLDKQITIYQLNGLHAKDQATHVALIDVINSLKLNKEQREIAIELDKAYFQENGEILLEIASKIGSLPTGNSFALIQKPYNIVETHNLQVDFSSFLSKIYPYYRQSYLNKDISSIRFRNVDSFKFLEDENQIFGLLKLENIPEYLKQEYSVDSIPLENPEQTEKFKEELGWF